jgi:hypothetical protein
MGEDEIAAGHVKFKNLSSGEQLALPRTLAGAHVRRLLRPDPHPPASDLQT